MLLAEKWSHHAGERHRASGDDPTIASVVTEVHETCSPRERG